MKCEFQHFRVEHRSDATTVWMEVAGKPVNVFSEEVLTELNDLLSQLESAGDGVPIMFRSAKAKGFAAGADLKRIAAMQSVEEVDLFLQRGQRVFDRLAALPQTTLAVITGACLGGGLEFALACRRRVVIESPAGSGTSPNQIGLPETTLGLIPAWGGTQRLPRLIGLSVAIEMMLSGRSLTAHEAQPMGLIDGILSGPVNDADLARWIESKPDVRKEIPTSDASVSLDDEHWHVEGETEAARRAVLRAVRAGWPDDMDAGLTAERVEFCRLVFSEFARVQLERFSSRDRSKNGGTT